MGCRMFKSFFLALVTMVCLAAPVSAQPTDLSNSKIKLAEDNGDGGYRPVKSKEYKGVRERLMKRKALEEFARFLSPLRLPATLWIYASECDGGANASPYYSPAQHAINMCYQFVDAMEKVADNVVKTAKSKPTLFPAGVGREEFITGSFIGVILHEAGHAVFDILDVPIFGREEDAADQMAAFIALQFDKDVARSLVKGISYLWFAQSDPPTQSQSDVEKEAEQDATVRCFKDPFCAYSDEHGTAGQRMFNAVCIAYGGDPKNFKDFAAAGWLPRNRDCVAEYQKLRFAFSKTVYPFIDPALMIKVQSIRWLRPNEMRKQP